MSDVKAAAERQRKHLAIVAAGGDLTRSPYWREVDEGICSLFDQDERLLADAWLAEYAADDDEPVTEEWLGLGWRREVDEWGCLHYYSPPFCVNHVGGQSYWVLCHIPESGELQFSLGGDFPLPDMKTRGQVRRLLAGLGITP